MTAAVLAWTTAAAAVTVAGLGDHGRTPSPWRVVFTGHGQATMPGQEILLAPERAASPRITHAALVVSARPNWRAASSPMANACASALVDIMGGNLKPALSS